MRSSRSTIVSTYILACSTHTSPSTPKSKRTLGRSPRPRPTRAAERASNACTRGREEDRTALAFRAGGRRGSSRREVTFRGRPLSGRVVRRIRDSALLRESFDISRRGGFERHAPAKATALLGLDRSPRFVAGDRQARFRAAQSNRGFVERDRDGTAAEPVDVRAGTLRGLGWSASSALLQQLLQFGFSIALARIPAPHDFGLIASVYVFVGFASLFVDSGFGWAIVQRTTLTQRHLSSGVLVERGYWHRDDDLDGRFRSALGVVLR